MINKNELKARLKQGEHLEDIFNFTDGQESTKENLKSLIISSIFQTFISMN